MDPILRKAPGPARPRRLRWNGPGRGLGSEDVTPGTQAQLPMFPLNTVLFPGVSVPLRVFEDRYRALVHHLLRVSDPAERVFGSVGHPRGLRGGRPRRPVAVPGRLPDAAHRGRVAPRRHLRRGRGRARPDRARAARHHRACSPSGTCWSGPGTTGDAPPEVVEAARATFAAYRVALMEIREDPFPDALPRDAGYLSWTLAAVAPLPAARAAGAARGRGHRRAPDHGHRAAALGAAGDERDPVAAGDPGRPDALVAQLARTCETWRGSRPAARRPPSRSPPPGSTFELRPYDHDPRAESYGLEAAEALGVAPEQVFKTLVAAVDGALAVAVVPVSGLLDLKALARALGGSRATMADPAAAQRATGYVVGGISPVGQRRRAADGGRRRARWRTRRCWSRPVGAASTSRSPRPTWWP